MLDDDALATISRAIAHPARIRILRLLSEQSECRGADVFSDLPLAQSTISEHLRVLKEAGVVNSRPVGTGMVYCIVPEALTAAADSIGALAQVTNACGLSANLVREGS